MGARVLDGRALAARVRAEVAEGVEAFRREVGRPPGLAVLLVGDDPASHTYVRQKERAAAEVGIASFVQRLPGSISQRELLSRIDALNEDPRVDGILVQHPLPSHLDEAQAFARIHPDKDVDGFHPVNAGLLWQGKPRLVPCTPRGIVRLVQEGGLSLRGCRAAVLGRSNIVGRPTAALLLLHDATVTLCHSHTRDLVSVTREADLLVVAVGRPGFLRAEMVRPGAVVVDVGIHRVDGRLTGDVDYSGVSHVAGAITPVPGGVGPMTVAMLLSNTLEAARWRQASAR